jgi:hypothetical protein
LDSSLGNSIPQPFDWFVVRRVRANPTRPFEQNVEGNE